MKDTLPVLKVREFDGVPYRLYGTAQKPDVAARVEEACQGKGAMTRLTHRFFPRKYFIWVNASWGMRSGIYARFGAVNKDVITEATAQEFRDWLAIKGLNISFMSDGTLNGFFMERQEPFRQWEIRTAFIRDAEAKGITVYKVRDDWEAFKEAYQKEAQRRYG